MKRGWASLREGCSPPLLQLLDVLAHLTDARRLRFLEPGELIRFLSLGRVPVPGCWTRSRPRLRCRPHLLPRDHLPQRGCNAIHSHALPGHQNRSTALWPRRLSHLCGVTSLLRSVLPGFLSAEHLIQHPE